MANLESVWSASAATVSFLCGQRVLSSSSFRNTFCKWLQSYLACVFSFWNVELRRGIQNLLEYVVLPFFPRVFFVRASLWEDKGPTHSRLRISPSPALCLEWILRLSRASDAACLYPSSPRSCRDHLLGMLANGLHATVCQEYDLSRCKTQGHR